MISNFISRLLRRYIKSRNLPVLLHKIKFRFIHGYWPNLDNPRRFSEKILYRILFVDDPLYYLYANKALAPYYIRSLRIEDLKTNETYGTWNKFTESLLEELPNKFVVKSTYGSGLNLIVQNKQKLTTEALTKFNTKLKTITNAKGIGTQYNGALVEKYLDGDDTSIRDFKIHCFWSDDGEFDYFFHVDTHRFTERYGPVSYTHLTLPTIYSV